MNPRAALGVAIPEPAGRNLPHRAPTITAVRSVATSSADVGALDARLEPAFRARLRRAAYVPLLVMLAYAFVLSIAVQRLLSHADWVDHTHAVIAQANECLLHTIDRESSLGGTVDRPAGVASALDDDYGRLQTLVADNPAQVARASALRERAHAYIAAAEEVRSARQRGAGANVAEARLRTQSSALRDGFAAFVGEENRLLARRANVLASGSRTDSILRFCTAAAVAALLTVFIRQQLRRLGEDYRAILREADGTARELRASEERYRLLNRELEARVRERTAELMAANERLKEVDRLKSEFLASMSHELRTPLNSIIGFTEILAAGFAGPINPEQKTQLGMVLNSSRHLLSLINDLLDLARIESGRVDAVRAWFDLGEVFDAVLTTLRPLAEKKGLPIETELPADRRVFSDRKMVFQVLLNLTNNAVKFTERGRVRLSARRDRDRLLVEVSDTGAGIKPEHLPILFESFRQIETAPHRKVEGTGLGLYLCRRLAGILGGEVSVRSIYGEGSTFTLNIPVQP